MPGLPWVRRYRSPDVRDRTAAWSGSAQRCGPSKPSPGEGPALHSRSDQFRRSDLPPFGHPRAVLDEVVAEEGRALFLHQGTDLAEQEPDLLFRAGCRTRLDRVPEGAYVRGPHQTGGNAVRSKPPHEIRLVFLLVERDAFVVEPEVLGHPELEGLHLLEQRGGSLHQLRIFAGPLREPEGDLVQ